ncbi:hypothetical protein D3C73_1363700 [compost metagenome]
MSRLAAVENAGVFDVAGQLRWPRALVVQFDGDQQRTVAVQGAGATIDRMQLFRRGIVDSEAFAARHQAFAQLRVAGQAQVQVQTCA